MVAEYNKAAREIFGAHGPGLQSGRMEGFQYDLLADSHSGSGPDTGPGTADVNPLPSGTLAPFDVIVVGMALHHVTEPGRLLKRFSELLKPGGVCVVLDMVPGSAQLGHSEDLKEVGHEGSVLATIGKHGFTEVEMRDLYEGAGMWGGFEYAVFDERFQFTLFGQQCSCLGFIARGEKL
jgi:SAM-dependent methyltransferase